MTRASPANHENIGYFLANRADREILFLPEVGSTNDYARKLFQKGCAAGTVVVARRQIGGRGRRGRSWSSPEGGLWFSLILPCGSQDSSIHKFPLIISLSVAQAMEERCGVKTELKWPNDVLIGGKKIAGILIERGTRDTGEGALLVGIGINVNLEEKVLQREGIQEVATSLQVVTGREEDLYALLLSVLDKIEENLHNLYYNQGDLLEKIAPRMSILGQMVAVQTEKDTIYGRASGLTQDGALVIQAGKRSRTLYSGDVLSLRPRESNNNYYLGTVSKEGFPMLLAIDVGNTQTVLGLFSGNEIDHSWRIVTPREQTTDEIAALFHKLFELYGLKFEDVTAVAISSVVPRLDHELIVLSRRFLEVDPLIIGPGVKTDLEIAYDNPQEVGADRIVNAVAAIRLYGCPCIVVDFGTATTFDAVAEGNIYLGGAISPGLEISTEALFAHAAKLSKVDLRKPTQAIGRNTADSIRSGVIMGFSGLVDGMVRRMAGEMHTRPKVIATGGLAEVVLDYCETIDVHDPQLTLKGLKFIYEMNH